MINTSQLKIGLLIPYSGVHTNLLDALERSLQLAFLTTGNTLEIQFAEEFIQNKDPKELDNTLLKLLQFCKVDLIIGVFGSKYFSSVISLAQRFKKPIIAINLGGDIPRKEISSPYFFYNSFCLWQSNFALGKWAQNNFGGIPATGVSVYEAGYDLHYAFLAGITVGGATEYKRTFLPYIPNGYDTSVLIDNWIIDKPDYGFALISGNEGKQFLQSFLSSELKEQLPLLLNYFMVEENTGCPPDLDLSNLPKIYTATGWLSSVQNEQNQLMVTAFSKEYDTLPGVYDLLGYEVGKVLANCVIETNAKDPENLVSLLNNTRLPGPRGEIFLSTLEKQQINKVYLLEAKADSGFWKHTVIKEEAGIQWNDSNLDSNQLVVSGWQNAYLCV